MADFSGVLVSFLQDSTHFICLTIVLLPDSPAPRRNKKKFIYARILKEGENETEGDCFPTNRQGTFSVDLFIFILIFFPDYQVHCTFGIVSPNLLMQGAAAVSGLLRCMV